MGTYAKFWKCALQVNPSTYSSQYRGKGHEMDAEAYADEILNICLEQEIKIIGIADHGDVSEVDTIRKKLSKKDIIVFPGFEIACSGKVHWVCLFHEDTHINDLNRYLGTLGLSSSGNGVRPSKLSASELIKCVYELGGFCYAAHVTDDNGILHRKKMEHVWKDPLLLAAQIPGSVDDLGNYKQIIKNKNPDYIREKPIGIINAKDVETPETLRNPKSSCYIKMTNPGFDAFKVAFKDPESRIRLHHEMKVVQYSCLEKAKFSGGYLDGIEIDLSSHLNTAIGGRGTGKSTLIECIRYALNIEPKGKEAKKQHIQIIKENLGKENARIEITLTSAQQNGKRYKVVRRYPDLPRVIDENGDESAMQPKDLLPGIEVYGQNEIYELTKDNNAILGVLERFMPKDGPEYEEEIRNIQAKLTLNAGELEKIYGQKDAIEEDVIKLPKLEEQRKNFQKLGIEDKLKILPSLESERAFERKIGNEIRGIEAAIEELTNSVSGVDFLKDKDFTKLPHKELFEQAHTILTNWKQKIEETSKSLSNDFEGVLLKLETIKKAILEAIECDEKLVEKQFSTIPGVSGKTGKQIGNEYKGLLRELERIRPMNEQVETLSIAEEKLLQKRRNLLGHLADTRFKRTEKLKKVVKQISRKLQGKVLIEVMPEQNRENLKSFLNFIPGIREKKVTWVDSQEDLTISALSNAINQGKEAVKALDWGITDMVAETLCNLSLSQKMALEDIDLQDRITIRLNVAHGDKENYRTLEKLSTGQQCTAILHLLLLKNPEPLIMDQPEDNLDNAFIADRIVKELRSAKTKRQFIFATHNANIPVFGDAEWIGVFKASNENAELSTELQGSIDVPVIRDNVANILEGGRDAFIQRKEKYDF